MQHNLNYYLQKKSTNNVNFPLLGRLIKEHDTWEVSTFWPFRKHIIYGERFYSILKAANIRGGWTANFMVDIFTPGLLGSKGWLSVTVQVNAAMFPGLKPTVHSRSAWSQQITV